MYFTECDGHTYGLECNQSCGKCRGGVQCDHVTGSCPNGCDAGMYGEKCDLGIVRVAFNLNKVCVSFLLFLIQLNWAQCIIIR